MEPQQYFEEHSVSGLVDDALKKLAAEMPENAAEVIASTAALYP